MRAENADARSFARLVCLILMDSTQTYRQPDRQASSWRVRAMCSFEARTCTSLAYFVSVSENDSDVP